MSFEKVASTPTLSSLMSCCPESLLTTYLSPSFVNVRIWLAPSPRIILDHNVFFLARHHDRNRISSQPGYHRLQQVRNFLRIRDRRACVFQWFQRRVQLSAGQVHCPLPCSCQVIVAPLDLRKRGETALTQRGDFPLNLLKLRDERVAPVNGRHERRPLRRTLHDLHPRDERVLVLPLHGRHLTQPRGLRESIEKFVGTASTVRRERGNVGTGRLQHWLEGFANFLKILGAHLFAEDLHGSL